MTSVAHRRSCLCSPSPVALLSVTEDEDAEEEDEEDCVGPGSRYSGARGRDSHVRAAVSQFTRGPVLSEEAAAAAESRVWRTVFVDAGA